MRGSALATYNRSMTMTRDDLAEKYLAQLPYTPYPVQEDALLAWFTAEQGVLVCAPTGTGKTLIAQAALVAGVERLERFVGLLEQVRPQARVGLRPVPRTSVRRPEALGDARDRGDG